MSRNSRTSRIVDKILTANAAYAAGFGAQAQLGLPPTCEFLILTCMDCRMDPAKFAGLVEGDAHVIRNAGGRATDDVIRSMVLSHKLMGTREWFVIHHTQCGLQFVTDEQIADLLAGSLDTAEQTPEGFRNTSEPGGSVEGRYMRWMTIPDKTRAVIDDVSRIRHHPLVNPAVPIYGYIYDVKTGQLTEVPEATAIGRARD